MTIIIEQLLNDLKDDDISVFATKYEEDIYIDFKESAPLHLGGKKKLDEVRNEFVGDLTSFANTAGGCLIYGIDEKNRIPVAFTPFEVESFDILETTLGQVIRTRSDPPVHGYKFFRVNKEKGNLLVVHIQRSTNGPHALIDPNTKIPIYYGRSSEGSKYPYNSNQLRNAIMYREGVNDRIRLYRDHRINKILNNDARLPLARNAKIILQLSPLSAFDSREQFNIEPFHSNYEQLKPMLDVPSSRSRRRNLDGLLVYDIASNSGQHNGYVQLNKNGIIEAVDAGILEQNHGMSSFKIISDQFFEKKLIIALIRFLRVLKSLGVNSPIYCALTLIGVKEFKIVTGNDFHSINQSDPIDEELLILPDFEISDLSDITVGSVAALLKDTFDLIWNASGRARSLNFDENGELKLSVEEPL